MTDGEKPEQRDASHHGPVDATASKLRRDMVASRLLRRGLSERKYFDSADASMAKGSESSTTVHDNAVESPAANNQPSLAWTPGSLNPQLECSPMSSLARASPSPMPISPGGQVTEGATPLVHSVTTAAAETALHPGLQIRENTEPAKRQQSSSAGSGQWPCSNRAGDSISLDALSSSPANDSQDLPSYIQHTRGRKSIRDLQPLPASNLVRTVELDRDGSLMIKSDAVVRVESRAGSCGFSRALETVVYSSLPDDASSVASDLEDDTARADRDFASLS